MIGSLTDVVQNGIGCSELKTSVYQRTGLLEGPLTQKLVKWGGFDYYLAKTMNWGDRRKFTE